MLLTENTKRSETCPCLSEAHRLIEETDKQDGVNEVWDEIFEGAGGALMVKSIEIPTQLLDRHPHTHLSLLCPSPEPLQETPVTAPVHALFATLYSPPNKKCTHIPQTHMDRSALGS